jgi:hypothetical protein
MPETRGDFKPVAWKRQVLDNRGLVTIALPPAPGPRLSPWEWDENLWRSIESWKLARSSGRPFPFKALGTLLLGVETACRGWDAWNAPRPAISDPAYAALGVAVALMSVLAIAINRSWLFRIIALLGTLCVLEVVLGWAGLLPWARWDLYASGYVQRLLFHAALIFVAVRRMLQPIDFAELGIRERGGSLVFDRALWLRLRMLRARGTRFWSISPEREAVLMSLERQVRDLRQARPIGDGVIEFRAGRHRWHARRFPHGVLLARLGAREWRAVSPRRFALREPRLGDPLEATNGRLVAVIGDDVLPAWIEDAQLERYRAWS